MAAPRVELGFHPRQGYVLPLNYAALNILNINSEQSLILNFAIR